jgi:hypothetical protein
LHDESTTRVANAGEPLTLDANEEPWHTDEDMWVVFQTRIEMEITPCRSNV